MKTFKFLQTNKQEFSDGLYEPHIPLLLTPLPQRKNIAVIATSLEDFNNWKRETLRGHQREHWNHSAICVFGNNRYQAITTINETRGIMVDDFIFTLRAWERREESEVIQEIATEILQYCLRRSVNEII